MSIQAAEAAVREGRLEDALKALQDAVRSKPNDARLRVFLFQLLCVRGQWERALNQLNVCAELDGMAMGMREMYRGAVGSEPLRAEVFAGHKTPLLFGEPEAWLALLIESRLRAGLGELEAADKLRQEAFEQAPASSGTLDGVVFEWIADADGRLGPVLEAVVNGRYYWVPFNRLMQVRIEPPEDLRDFVWAPAQLQFTNGGQTPALIPVRYPGSELSSDGLIALSRKTEWQEQSPEFYTGLGQRLLSTSEGDYPLLQCREIQFNIAPDE